MTTPLVRDQFVTPAAGSYRIDPVRSHIAFTTRHLFGWGRSAARSDSRTARSASPSPSRTARHEQPSPPPASRPATRTATAPSAPAGCWTPRPTPASPSPPTGSG